MTLSLLIPESVFETVERKLKKLVNKAGVQYELVPGITHLSVPELDVDGLSTYRQSTISTEPAARFNVFSCKRVTVGDMPRVQGYELIARIEHTKAGNIVNVVPGEECPDSYRHEPPECAHCGRKRNRKDTFILKTPTGELVQVGRNCLADFLRVDPSGLVKLAEYAAWVAQYCTPGEREFWGNGGSTPDTRGFLACAVASIEELGFVKSDGLCPTKRDAAWRYGKAPSNGREHERWVKAQPKESHYDTADRILEWASRISDTAAQYEFNLKVALALPAIGRNDGIVASAPVAYMKSLGIEAERKERARRDAETPDPGYLAAVGTRVEFEATLLRVIEIEREDSQWGGPTLYAFRTEAGHDIAWFSSGATPRISSFDGDQGRPVAPGDKLKLKGTVKSHQMYKNRHQTTVSRCKVMP